MGACGNKQDVKERKLEKKANQQGKAFSNIKVSPDIFVSLQSGSLSQYYRIGEVIGEGGFGCVRIATHKSTDIKRAIKQIRKDKIIKEDEQQMFAEVEILKTLDHPNIVKLYELYQDTKSYYLITEYLEGGELFDKLQNEKNFSEKLAAHYMKQILSAISYCHQNNIVHRDLKLENLLLESKNENANMKVIDFGTSRKVSTGEKLSRRIGTPYYMAPEVLSKSYNMKCDVWSCGVILYILLCGYPPFNGDDAEIKRKIQEGKYEFDPQEWDKISEDAKNLIRKMLTYNPDERISCILALNDPWIQSRAPSTPINNNVIKNLSSFYSSSKWKASIQIFIVTQVQTNREKEELLKQFKAMDKNNDGTLSRDEIIDLYTKVYERTKAEKLCNDLFESADYNRSGKIDFTEFLVACSNQEKLANRQRLEKVFKIFDKDQNGQISKAELQQIMGGIDVSEENWRHILDECDKNQDGEISLIEFIDLMQNYN